MSVLGPETCVVLTAWQRERDAHVGISMLQWIKHLAAHTVSSAPASTLCRKKHTAAQAILQPLANAATGEH